MTPTRQPDPVDMNKDFLRPESNHAPSDEALQAEFLEDASKPDFFDDFLKITTMLEKTNINREGEVVGERGVEPSKGGDTDDIGMSLSLFPQNNPIPKWSRKVSNEMDDDGSFPLSRDVRDPMMVFSTSRERKRFTPRFKINNVVFTFKIFRDAGTQLKVKNMTEICDYFEYNPKTFAALKMRLKNPKATLLIFQSGKVVGTGVKCPDAANLVAWKIVMMFRSYGIDADMLEFNIENIVATTYCCMPDDDEITALDLTKMYRKYPINSSYEPELFPGLVHRTKEPKQVYLIFKSGRIVATGAKSIEQMYQGWDSTYHDICLPFALPANFINTSSNYHLSDRRNASTICSIGMSYDNMNKKQSEMQKKKREREGGSEAEEDDEDEEEQKKKGGVSPGRRPKRRGKKVDEDEEEESISSITKQATEDVVLSGDLCQDITTVTEVSLFKVFQQKKA